MFSYKYEFHEHFSSKINLTVLLYGQEVLVKTSGLKKKKHYKSTIYDRNSSSYLFFGRSNTY